MANKLKVKKVKGEIETLRALPYKGYMVYVRRIPKLHIFEWLVSFEKQIYTSYMVMRPQKGKTKLSEDEVAKMTGLILAGATSTVDTLLGETVEGEAKKRAEAVLKAGGRAVN